MTRVPLITAALLCCSGCGDEKTYPNASMSVGRGALSAGVAKRLEQIDPKQDTDRDGIPDADELAGWTIRVDETGRDSGITDRLVTSNPAASDTDGDGLDDGAEKVAGSDPQSDDTDGDGLSDLDEVARWGTSPTSVDTDHDARGAGAQPNVSPDPNLFDGAELRLEADPLDPDGPLVAGPEATSPLQGDTDGDGVWDYDEEKTPLRSAVVADMPTLVVVMTPSSALGLYLELTTTDGTNVTSESGKQFEFGGGFGTTSSTSATIKTTEWMHQFSRMTTSVEASAGGIFTPPSFNVSTRFDAAVGVGASSSIASTTSFGGEIRTNLQQQLSETETEARSSQRTISGGRIVMRIDVKNVGGVPCKVSNLTFALATLDPRTRQTRPVAQLEPTQGLATELTLAVGEALTLEVQARNLPAARVMDLMRDASRLVIAPANYDVFTAGDDNYDFIQEDVEDRTALVAIDFGGEGTTTYRVAATVNTDADGAPAGISVANILDLVGVHYGVEPLPEGTSSVGQRAIFNIEDSVTELYDTPAPPMGDPIDYPAGVDPGTRMVKRGWYAMIERKAGRVDFDANLFRASLFPGDRLTLVRLDDRDRDGLPALEESLRGTSDEAIDTDGDGLSDFFELHVGWPVAVQGGVPRQEFPDPTAADADGDGLTDLYEIVSDGIVVGGSTVETAGTSPWNADTDGDGLGDKQELDDDTDDRWPLRWEDRVAPTYTCTVSGQWFIPCCDDPRSSPPRDGLYTSLSVSDDSGVAEVLVGYSDGHEFTYVISPPRPRWDVRLANDRLITHLVLEDIHGNAIEVGAFRDDGNDYQGVCR